MEPQQQAKFDGWAVIEQLGHVKYAGYVTTEAFGQAVLFRVDVPALAERERVTKQPGYISGHGYVPAGTKVTEGPIQGFTKLLGAGTIYAITPCSKEAALEAVEAIQPRPLMSVDVPPDRSLTEGELAGVTASAPDVEFDDEAEL